MGANLPVVDLGPGRTATAITAGLQHTCALLLDATVIRMVLVPAFMHLMGRWNWWPGGRRHPPERLH